MLRMPLVELCLQIKLLSLGYVKPFLSMVSNAIF
jgi:ATP-dependent RNA helicase DHX29